MFGMNEAEYKKMQEQKAQAAASVKPLTDAVPFEAAMDHAVEYTFCHFGRYFAQMLDSAKPETAEAYAKLVDLMKHVQANNRHKIDPAPGSYPSAAYWCRLKDADDDLV